MTMPTNARIASRTPRKMTRRLDRFTNVFPLQLGGWIRTKTGTAFLQSGCDCGQQSRGDVQMPSTRLVGYRRVVPDGWCADQRQSPRREAGGSASVRAVGLATRQVRADVLEDAAHDRAQEEQGNDHDDGDEGEEQTVLNERLAVLIVLAEL